MLYSGKERNKAAGVTLALSDAANKCLVELEQINDRILRACFSTTQVKMTFIALYAPKNESSDSDKDTFYQSLSDITNKVHFHYILIMCGDFNVKVAYQEYAPTVIGPHGLSEINENGLRLIDYCVTNGMIVGST